MVVASPPDTAQVATQTAILDALTAHVALLDHEGFITSVNEAWRLFADANDHSPGHDIGSNYLDICRRARGVNATLACEAAVGIRSVLDGAAPRYSLEYPCHSPTLQRWFSLTATPLPNPGRNGAVVMHVDISERVRATEVLKRQHRELRVLFDLMPAMIWFKDTRNNILRVNQVAADAAGRPIADIEGKSSHEIYPADAARYFAEDLQVIRSGLPSLRIVEQLVAADGTARWVQVDKMPHFDDDGQVTGVVVVAQDITQHKRAESDLRESEMRFRQMAENIHDVFFLADAANGRVLYVSPAYEEIWGTSRADLYANPRVWTEAIHPDDREAVREKYRTGVATGVLVFQYRLVRPDGSLRWIETRGFPVRDDAGNLVRIAGIAKDVTELVRATGLLRESERRFTGMMDRVQLASVMLDLEGRITYCNQYLLDLTGWRLEEVIGQDWFETFMPVELGDMKPMFASLLADLPEAWHVENELFTRARKRRLVRWNNSVLRSSTGEVTGVASIGEDITAQRQAEIGAQRASEELRRSENLKSAILESSLDCIVSMDHEGRIIEFNAAAEDAFGWSRSEAIGQDLVTLIVPERFRDAHRRGVARYLATGQVSILGNRRVELEAVRADGSEFPVELAISATGDSMAPVFTGFIRDISRRREAERKLQRTNRVLAVLSGINALIVRVRTRDALFQKACRIAVELGQFELAWIGLVEGGTTSCVHAVSANPNPAAPALDCAGSFEGLTPHSSPSVERAILEGEAVVTNDAPVDAGAAFGRLRQQRGILSEAVIPLFVAGKVVGVFALYAKEPGFFDEAEMELLSELAGDIAFAIDHIEKDVRLDYLAYYDPLTGLANQSLFVERLKQALYSPHATTKKTAVFVVDIDRFKSVNDAFGRTAGDDLLRQIAARFMQFEGSGSRFARIGVDRFAIYVSDMDDPEQVGRYAEERVAATFGKPFRIGDADLRVSIKLGIALFPDDGSDAETLLRNAEAALKKAKASGERFVFFAPKMNERVAERLSLEHRLRVALENEEFLLYYQPKLDMATGLLTGAEALIRWDDPATGLVPPGMFIPVLEQTGLIHEVGHWALRKAVDDYRRWREQGLPAVRIAVNVSPLQLRSRHFVGEIESILSLDPHAAAGLELEITESLIMEDVGHSIEVLRAIRSMDVRIGIDDFGTGFSSLSYLSQLPMDTLKIDRSFINDMTVSKKGLALVSTIINMAHSFEHCVVAEGVETAEQWHLLHSLGCDEMQGFLVSRPLPVTAFEAGFLSSRTDFFPASVELPGAT